MAIAGASRSSKPRPYANRLRFTAPPSSPVNIMRKPIGRPTGCRRASSAGVQEQTKLVGLGRVARRAVGSEMVLPCLDVVLGLTTRAVEPLVEVLGAATFQAGDDEPGIGALEPSLDAGDDALDPAPALRGIVELPEAPHLAAPGRRLEARGGALLQRCDMTAECGVGGQAEDPIHPVLPAPVEHFGGRIMAVGAQQDLDLWPMAAQGADQAAHKAADLHPARPLAGPQQRGDKTALCVEHNDRLEPVIVVVGVEQAQLLAAMHAVEGVI